MLYLRRQGRTFGGWVCLSDKPALQQALRDLHRQGLVQRRKAVAVLAGYSGSSAYAYRLLPDHNYKIVCGEHDGNEKQPR